MKGLVKMPYRRMEGHAPWLAWGTGVVHDQIPIVSAEQEAEAVKDDIGRG